MKARTLTVWMTGLLLSASFTSNAQNVPVATGRYTPDWDNLAQWECPEWFQNVKFGIWAHWDPQSQGGRRRLVWSWNVFQRWWKLQLACEPLW